MKKWRVTASKFSKKLGQMMMASYYFQSDAKTVKEAQQALYSAGFVCFRKNFDGEIVPVDGMIILVASGDL